jgi:DNA invertase Pin-like site-specific DNA recombinase
MAVCHAYTRESTLDQEYGLQVQAEQVEAYYRTRLLPRYPGLAWGTVHCEKGTSGGKEFVRRKVGRALNERLERDDQVIVSKLDRGFRDTLDYLTIERAWKDRGITLHVLDLPLLGADIPDYIGDALRAMLAIFAQLERQRIRVRTREVKAWLKAQGRATNGHAGYGFKLAGPQGGRRPVPDDHERQVMRWIAQQRLQGVPWEVMYFELLKQRELTREGKEWSLSRIRRACQAEFFLQAQELQNGHGASSTCS